MLLAVLLVHRIALAERPAGGGPRLGWALRPLAPHAAVLAAYHLGETQRPHPLIVERID